MLPLFPKLQVQSLGNISLNYKTFMRCQTTSKEPSHTFVQGGIHMSKVRATFTCHWKLNSHFHSKRKEGCDNKITQGKTIVIIRSNLSPHFPLFLNRIGIEVFKNVIAFNSGIKQLVVTCQKIYPSKRVYELEKPKVLS